MTSSGWGDEGRALKNALGIWRAIVEGLEAEVRAELRLGAADVMRPRDVVNEVIRLADPHAVAHRDAVIPGGRDDLARSWIKARLSRTVATPEQCLTFARSLAPDPGSNHELAAIIRGQQRWRTLSEFGAEVSRQAAERFADEAAAFS